MNRPIVIAVLAGVLVGVLGVSARMRWRLILTEGLAIGIAGTLLGLALGVGLAAGALKLMGSDLGLHAASSASTELLLNQPLLWPTLVYAALGLAAALVAAVAPALTVRLEAPHELHPGEHAEIVALVHAEDAARGPILVTPTIDGAAVEVVRGRLFRFDADDPASDPLRFRVPVLARSVGTAVLSVRVDGHACEGAQCAAVDAEATARIDVR